MTIELHKEAFRSDVSKRQMLQSEPSVFNHGGVCWVTEVIALISIFRYIPIVFLKHSNWLFISK